MIGSFVMVDICVLGLGYVGLPTASLLADAGYHVLGVDIDDQLVAMLEDGKTRLKEAALATLVAKVVKGGNLVPAKKPDLAHAFIICVPTTVTASKAADLKAVEQAASDIVPLLRYGNLVILESTSPVGTTRDLVGRVLRESGLEPGGDFDLCYCPERALIGNTRDEISDNHRVIGGVTPRSAVRAQRLYERISRGQITLTDDRTAELCKLMENTYRDVNIAMANVFARIAEDAAIDVWEAIEHANLHSRVHIHKPGPGVGGHCIPVDPWYLAEGFPHHTELLRQSRLINDTQSARLLELLWATGKLKKGDTLAVLGAAYKKDMDDPRGSPAALFATAARNLGLDVSVHDPLVKAGDYQGLVVSNDLPECLHDASAAVLLCEHSVYRSLSAEFFWKHLGGRLIADGRNCLNHTLLRQAGFDVIRLGAPRVKAPVS
jgi:UDP-N-acetyl-D-mannosaminuronic acid dehydrogenase